MNFKPLVAEFIGTFWLVLGGCGAAVLAASSPGAGIGTLGVSFAFGLSVVTMAYALGSISGGHFNPAITLSCWVAKRITAGRVVPYVIAQTLGAICAAAVLYYVASASPVFDPSHGFATNGYGAHSPAGYPLQAAIVIEFVLTMLFTVIVLGVTAKPVTAPFAPLAIGLALTLIHLVSIPVTNTSVNPARSTGVALIQGGPALQQLWVFWLVPLVAGAAGGVLHRLVLAPRREL
ncbi:aquaporin Z [Luteimonas sp. S4-F44]|uniref:aquaporin Z n=1 Tax=Luteimonas sp. S4-F44 TaxID=2925842 RepID=UPI001F53D2BC|nr:aquaporin Z [Luteimonas sp. S4-F44]UNK43085.1 aquaporin Z [Luteimonas sp. S4-F44]